MEISKSNIKTAFGNNLYDNLTGWYGKENITEALIALIVSLEKALNQALLDTLTDPINKTLSDAVVTGACPPTGGPLTAGKIIFTPLTGGKIV